MSKTLYPVAALLSAHGGSHGDLAATLGLQRPSVAKAVQRGLSPDTADRWATRCGFHPYEVWPDMRTADIAEAERREATALERKRARSRAYAAKRRQDPAYRARQAAYMREYRASERAKEAARVARRNYYKQNRERELERQRIYDRTVRAARRRAA